MHVVTINQLLFRTDTTIWRHFEEQIKTSYTETFWIFMRFTCIIIVVCNFSVYLCLSVLSGRLPFGVRFMRYSSVGCTFVIRSVRYVSVLIRCISSVCPLCIRYTSVLFGQHINGLTTDNNFVNEQLLFSFVRRPFVLSGKVWPRL